MTSVWLTLRPNPIPVDPPREEAPEPTAITEVESEHRYPLGAGLPRTYPRTAKTQEN